MKVRERSVVEITRVFDFPRESVFRMWIEPRNVARWWGPEGCVVVVCEVDTRPGGAMRIDVQMPDGPVHTMTGTFRKVVAPELLIFRSAAPNGGVGSSPWEALNTVTFEELGPKRTRVTVVVDVLTAAPDETEALKRGFKGGWAESFERLQKALS